MSRRGFDAGPRIGSPAIAGAQRPEHRRADQQPTLCVRRGLPVGHEFAAPRPRFPDHLSGYASPNASAAASGLTQRKRYFGQCDYWDTVTAIDPVWKIIKPSRPGRIANGRGVLFAES